VPVNKELMRKHPVIYQRFQIESRIWVQRTVEINGYGRIRQPTGLSAYFINPLYSTEKISQVGWATGLSLPTSFQSNWRLQPQCH